ncbi:MAG TPA: MFS transporter [Thermoanaerobaculia bacterium]|nr:MFS transporter [Thermoanaerobaculia bacterium]
MAEPLFTRRFIALWLFAFVAFFSAFQLLPAIPFRILDLGGTKSAAGRFLAVYTFASAFAAPVMGTLADHIGRRRMLVIASLLFIGFSMAYGVVTKLPLLLGIGVIHGALWSGILAASGAIMSETIPLSRRTEGLAYWGIASTAAVAVAPAIGLHVFEHGWFVLCVELAMLSVVMTVWSALMPHTERPAPSTRPALRETWDLRVTLTATSLAVASFGYGGITSYAAILSVERGIKPESLYFTVFAITIIVVRIFTSPLGDRFGPRRVLLPSLVMMPIAFIVLALAWSRAQLIASAILFGIGLGGAFPAFIAFILERTDPERRARTFGSVVWAFDTGIGSGSFAVGLMAQRWGFTTAFLVAAGFSCFSIPIFLASSRRLGRGTGVAPEAEHA